MIKGINKQIIELKCTNDEYFEKALLFVRADRADVPYDELLRSAESYTAEISPEAPPRKRPKARLMLIGAGAASLAVLVVCLMLFG